MLSKKYSRRRALQVMGGMAGGLLIHACANGNRRTTQSASGEMQFKLGGVMWMGLTPMFIAQEQGFFEEENLIVDFFGFDSTADFNEAFLARELEACAPIGSEAITLATKGKDYRIVLVEDMSVGGDGILARNNIEGIEDFAGKEIAVERGTVSYFFLLEILQDVGLSESDISIVEASPSSAAAAYQKGNVEIAVTYAPYLNQANQQISDGRIIYDSSQKPTAITDLYAFEKRFIDNNPEAIEAFVRGIFKGIDFLEQNRQEGIAIAAQRLQISPEQLEADLEGIKLPDAQTNLEMFSDSESEIYLAGSLSSLAQLMLEEGEISQAPNMDNYIEPRFVEAVANG